VQTGYSYPADGSTSKAGYISLMMNFPLKKNGWKNEDIPDSL
jgi:hypothetical protein